MLLKDSASWLNALYPVQTAIPTKQSQPHYAPSICLQSWKRLKLQKLNELCPALRSTDLLLLYAEMKQVE